jgi:hypothetical protein
LPWTSLKIFSRSGSGNDSSLHNLRLPRPDAARTGGGGRGRGWEEIRDGGADVVLEELD